MRLFIGFAFEQKQLDNLNKMQNMFLPYLVSGKKIEQGNLHCTLLFLGNVQNDNLPSAIEKVAKAVKGQQTILTGFWEMTLFSNGCLTLKLKQSKALAALHESLKNQFADITQDSGKKFVPHITLFRDAKTEMHFKEVKKNVPVFNIPFEIKEITLFESKLTNNGAEYLPKTIFKLNT